MAETRGQNLDLPTSETKAEFNLDSIHPKLAALAWENFLKRIADGMKEEAARPIFFGELQEYMGRPEPKNPNMPFLDGNPDASYEELKKYLADKLMVSESRFAFGALHELFDLYKRGSRQEQKEMEIAQAEYEKAKQETLAEIGKMTIDYDVIATFIGDYNHFTQITMSEASEKTTYKDLAGVYRANTRYMLGLMEDVKNINAKSSRRSRTREQV